MNPFQLPFQDRLHSWRTLRHKRDHLAKQDFIVEVDRWWQQAPLIKQHLHWNDQENWTDPWTMLSENEYCTLTRAIGMIYSLVMCGIEDIELIIAMDHTCEEHYLVTVEGAKYILNYWPNSVLSTTLAEFSVVRSVPIDSIFKRIK